jgi:hypothetical protein
MFVGHFGLAFGAKKAVPAVSLAALFAACQLADLLWPTLVLLGYERVDIQPGATRFTPLNFVSYPYSHSLLALCLWGVAFGAIYAVLRRGRVSAFVTIALLVVSHWLLDYVTHRPDMPITIGGLIGSVGPLELDPGTLVVELAMFAIGGGLYSAQRHLAIGSDRLASGASRRSCSSCIWLPPSAHRRRPRRQSPGRRRRCGCS